jgi:CHASE3 domain sensor protein
MSDKTIAKLNWALNSKTLVSFAFVYTMVIVALGAGYWAAKFAEMFL